MSYIVEERALNSDWDGKKRSSSRRSREMMTTWSSGSNQNSISDKVIRSRAVICPSCGHTQDEDEDEDRRLNNVLEDLPAGVKFDPSDQEILQHLEAKVFSDSNNLHPLIDHFIPTIDGQNGICYTHPEKLPGVSKQGQVRHFFHRPSKAYTTGTRKRRKVHSDDDDGSETRWHKTGKTRPVSAGGSVKGYKKILVLYSNYGRQRKPDKTNWVMHQYHLGHNQEETDGQLVLSKVFYQTQPRQCAIKLNNPSTSNSHTNFMPRDVVYYNPNPNPNPSSFATLPS